MQPIIGKLFSHALQVFDVLIFRVIEILLLDFKLLVHAFWKNPHLICAHDLELLVRIVVLVLKVLRTLLLLKHADIVGRVTNVLLHPRVKFK